MKGQARFVAAGFRVTSGRAVVVLLDGSRRSPALARRAEIVLCDPAEPATRQPYHAARGTLERDEKRLASRLAAIRRATDRAVLAMLREGRELGLEIAAATLVVGSLKAPEAIGNEHVRAHALEGRLFRTVLADALAAQRVPVGMIEEREAYDKATAVLARSAAELKVALVDLGRPLGKPWQADQKLAALAAWCLLP